MGPGDIFWFFLMLSAFQPVITRRLMEYSRQRMIAKIERDRGSRVILLVHRQETMNFLGFPLVRYIDVDDSEEVIRAIHMTDKDVPIDIILHTPGGLVLCLTTDCRRHQKTPRKSDRDRAALRDVGRNADFLGGE